MKRYSKAKANGNHVVWTGDQVIPVPFVMSGLTTSDDMAFLRVGAAGMTLNGFTVNFRVPAGDRAFSMTLQLSTADDQLIPGTLVTLTGIRQGGDFAFGPINMPPNSLWKIVSTVLSGDEAYNPQDMTVTYNLAYGNGPVRSNLWSATPTLAGIGFYTVDGTFIVQ